MFISQNPTAQKPVHPPPPPPRVSACVLGSWTPLPPTHLFWAGYATDVHTLLQSFSVLFVSKAV